MNEANEIVDKVAAKLAEASESLRPIAETVVRECAQRYLIFAIGLGVLCLGLVAIGAALISIGKAQKQRKNSHSTDGDGYIVCSLAVFGAAAGAVIGAFMCLSIWASPTYEVARELLGR